MYIFKQGGDLMQNNLNKIAKFPKVYFQTGWRFNAEQPQGGDLMQNITNKNAKFPNAYFQEGWGFNAMGKVNNFYSLEITETKTNKNKQTSLLNRQKHQHNL